MAAEGLAGDRPTGGLHICDDVSARVVERVDDHARVHGRWAWRATRKRRARRRASNEQIHAAVGVTHAAIRVTYADSGEVTPTPA
jgi:hypothetical protein